MRSPNPQIAGRSDLLHSREERSPLRSEPLESVPSALDFQQKQAFLKQKHISQGRTDGECIKVKAAMEDILIILRQIYYQV